MYAARCVSLFVLTFMLELLTPLSVLCDEPEKSTGMSPEQQERWNSTYELLTKLEKRRANGEKVEYLPIVKAAVSIVSEMRSNRRRDDYFAVLETLTAGLEANDENAGAESIRNDILSIAEQQYGLHHWRTADARQKLIAIKQSNSYTPGERKELQEASAMEARAFNEAKNDVELQRTLLKQSSAVRRRLQGESHPETISALNALSRAYFQAGDPASAFAVTESIVASLKRSYGEKHPLLAESLYNLARLHGTQAQFGQCKSYTEASLAIYKDSLGERHPQYIACLSQLALTTIALKEYASAEKHYKAVIDLRGQSSEPDSLAIANDFDQLAVVYSTQMRFDAACDASRSALQLRKQKLGETHSDYLKNLEALANLLESGKDLQAAEALYTQSLAVKDKTLGKSSEESIKTLLSLLRCISAKDELKRAIPLMSRYLAYCNENGREDDPAYVSWATLLAIQCQTARDFSQADSIIAKVGSVHKRKRKAGQKDYLASLTFFGAGYFKIKEYARALPLLREAVDVQRQISGIHSTEYADRLMELALAYLYEAQGDSDKQVTFNDSISAGTLHHLSQVLVAGRPGGASTEAVEGNSPASIQQRKLNEKLETLDELARRKLSQEQVTFATTIEGIVLDKEAISGANSDEAVALVKNCAAFLEHNSEVAPAEALYTKVVEAKRSRFGSDHWHTIDARLELQEVKLQRRLTPADRTQLARADDLARRAEANVERDPKSSEADFLECLKEKGRILGTSHEQCINTLASLSKLYQKRNDLVRAEATLKEARQLVHDSRGINHPAYANVAHELAVIYNSAKRLPESAEQARLALEVRQKVFGEQHVDSVRSLLLLAATEFAQGNVKQCESLYLRALDIHKQTGGEQSLEFIQQLDLLAQIYFVFARYDDAISRSKQALALRQKLHEESHVDLLPNLDRIAKSYQEKKDFKGAAQYYQMALAIRDKAVGKSHADTLSTLSGLVKCIRPDDDFEQFEPALARFCSARELRTDPVFVPLGRALATHYVLTERHSKAESVLLLLLEVVKEKPAEYVRCLHSLEDVHRRRQEFGKAEAYCREAMDIQKRLFGEDSFEYISESYSLGSCLQAAGEFNEAEVLFKRAIQHYRSRSATERDGFQAILNSLAGLYCAKGDQLQAHRLYAESLEIVAQTKGKLSAEYAGAVNRLALFDVQRQSVQSAVARFREAAAIFRQLGKNHPQYCETLIVLARLQMDTGRINEAEALVVEVMAIQKASFGMRSAEYAEILFERGALHQLRGEFQQASKAIEESLSISRSIEGERSELTASRLHVAGLEWSSVTLSYESREVFINAERLLKESLEIWKELYGEQDGRYLTVLVSLASLYRHFGAFGEADEVHLRLAGICDRMDRKQVVDYAAILDEQFELCQARGDFGKAALIIGKSLAYRKEAFGQAHPQYAISLQRAAKLAGDEGRIVESEKLYREAAEIRRKCIGETDRVYLECLDSVAILYLTQGDYARAQLLLKQLLSIRERCLGEQHPDYPICLSTLASVYMSCGDYVQAESMFRRAMQFDDNEGEVRKVPLKMIELGGFYQSQGDFKKAEPLLREAVAIRKRELGEWHANYADSLISLGSMFIANDDFKSAEPLFENALRICRFRSGENHVRCCFPLERLAYVFQSQGNFSKAELLLRESLRIRQATFGADNHLCCSAQCALAFQVYVKGDKATATELSLKSSLLSREWLRRTASIQSERQQLSSSLQARPSLDACLAFGDDVENAYQEVLHWKGAVSERQVQMRALAKSQGDAKVAELFRQLRMETIRLTRLAQSVPDSSNPRKLNDDLSSASREIERLEAELAGLNDEFRQAHARRQCTTADIQRALPEGAVLVDFLEYNRCVELDAFHKAASWKRSLVAFIVRRGHDVTRVELGEVEAIEKAISNWRKDFGGAFDQSANSSGRVLREAVWEKVRPHLRNARLVMVSPDGDMAKMPWQALPGDAAGSWLIEDFSFFVLPIPSLLPQIAASPNRKPASQPSLLLVGDIDYAAELKQEELQVHAESAFAQRGADEQLWRWSALPGSKAEINSIGQLFQEQFPAGNSETLSGSQATKHVVVKQLPNHGVVHFATHGFFAPPHYKSVLTAATNSGKDLPGDRFVRQDISGFHPGLLSGIVLTGANRRAKIDQEDGILTALEVGSIEMSEVELVTLSACETGLGQTAGGEGVWGLQRAFQLAGAKTVVASLWTIPDRPTQMLMARFYDNLWKKKLPKLEALREAQLWMLRDVPKDSGLLAELNRGLALPIRVAAEDNPRLPPYHWGAFVLSGDWR